MKALSKYVKFAKRLFPDAQFGLRRGISAPEQLKVFEGRVIFEADSLVRLLGTNNGQKIGAKGLIPSVSEKKSCVLLDAGTILNVWVNIPPCQVFYGENGKRRVSESSPEVKDIFWAPDWVPFAQSSELGRVMVTYFLDFAPTVYGTWGQVVEECWYIRDEMELVNRRVVAASIESFFESLVVADLKWTENEGIVLN